MTATTHFSAAETGLLEVTVVDPLYAPVMGARVQVYLNENTYTRSAHIYEATTNAEGFAAFPDLPHGSYGIATTHENGSGAHHTLVLSERYDIQSKRIQIWAGEDIRGRVVGFDKKPIGNVSIFYDGGLPVASTDADGQFLIDKAKTTGSGRYLFEKEGLGTVAASLSTRAGPTYIVMGVGGKARITVIDENGDPVPEVWVSLLHHEIPDAPDDGQTETTLPIEAGQNRSGISLQTDTNGYVETPFLNTDWPIRVRVRVYDAIGIAEHEELVALEANATVDHQIQINRIPHAPESFVKFRANMKLTGLPVSGTAYLGNSDRRPSMPRIRIPESGEAELGGVPTDVEFQASFQPDDPYLVVVSGPRKISLEPGRRFGEVLFVAEPGITIEGRVVDDAGLGIPEFHVEAHSPAYRGKSPRALSLSDGTFRIIGVPAQPRVNLVAHDGGWDARKRIRLGEPGTSVQDVVIAIEGYQRPQADYSHIRARIVDRNGDALPGTTIRTDAYRHPIADEHGYVDVYADLDKTPRINTMYQYFQVTLNDHTASDYGEVIVSEGNELPSHQKEGEVHTFTVQRHVPAHAFMALFIDEEGRRLPASCQGYYCTTSSTTNDRGGRAVKLVESQECPVFFHISYPGYQSRFISSEKDFAWGELNVIQLWPEPYPPSASRFTTITGYPETPEFTNASHDNPTYLPLTKFYRKHIDN